MGFRTAVIVPPVVCHHLDPHTGIPFMPHMAAHMAGALHAAGFEPQVIDSFGLQPFERALSGEFMFLGAGLDWIVRHIAPDVGVVYIYCRTMAEFLPITQLCQKIKQARPSVKIALFENIQSVTSFSLGEIADDLLQAGCDVLVLGEPEKRAGALTELLLRGAQPDAVAGLIYLADGVVKKTQAEPFNEDLDALPLPLWERFPLEGYWKAGFAHAPNTDYRFLPILTSRGCPYRCTFCISPSLNPRWRGRSAVSVADEMEYFYRLLDIREFHVSDLDPTVNDKRTQDICRELIRRKLPIRWKLAQGTKIETIKSEQTLELMAQAGVSFSAFSPESGSPRMLKIMNKPFSHEHGLRMVRKMSALGIHTQACFIAGVPGENEDDRQQSLSYLRKLMDAGLSEVAVYVFAPIPGAVLSDALKGYNNYSQCTFSPTWREDYREVNWYRMRMYALYFWRLALQPRTALKRVMGFLTGAHNTKMEMSVKKQLKLIGLQFAPWLFPRLDAVRELSKAMAFAIPARRGINHEPLEHDKAEAA